MKKYNTSAGKLQVIRILTDRIRIKSEELFSDPKSAYCQKYIESLFTVDGVETIKVNPITKTMLICHDPDFITSRILLKLVREKHRGLGNNDFRPEAKTVKLSGLYEKFGSGNDAKFSRYGDLITTCEIRHSIAGRLRLKWPTLYLREKCCKIVEKKLREIPGVREARINPRTTSILVYFDQNTINNKRIIEAIEYLLHTIAPENWNKMDNSIYGIGLSTFTLGITLVSGASAVLAPVSFALVAYSAIPIFRKSYDSLKARRIKVDILDATVIGMCLATRHYSAGAFMVWVLDIAGTILDRTNEQSKNMLTELFGKKIRRVFIKAGGNEIEVPIESIRTGDTIVVSTGEAIPVDGIIINGEGMVDQHVLTGESAPVEKIVKDKVYASTLLVGGKIYISAENIGDNTVESQIIKLLQASAEYKVKVQNMGEKFADMAVIPTLALGALGMVTRGPGAAMAIINADFGTGIRVAAPTALLGYIAQAAHKGIIIKRGSVLEDISNVTTFVFDKTGTLTRDVPEVAEIFCTDGFDEKKILSFAASAEQRFSHPIAKAILQKAKEFNTEIYDIDNSRYSVGFGIKTACNGNTIKVGSLRFMKNENIKISESVSRKLSETGKTNKSAILVAVDNEIAGIILLQSSQRPEASGLIESLHNRGIKTVLLSGDHEAPTRELAGKLGISDYQAQVLPQDKGNFVKKLQARGEKIAMVGDGVNDSLALSLADVSISLSGASDIANDVAHVILMDSDLGKLESLFELSSSLQNTVKTSFYTLAVLPNTVCMFGALFGVVGLGASLILNNVFNFISTINAALPLAECMEISSQINEKNNNPERADLDVAKI